MLHIQCIERWALSVELSRGRSFDFLVFEFLLVGRAIFFSFFFFWVFFFSIPFTVARVDSIYFFFILNCNFSSIFFFRALPIVSDWTMKDVNTIYTESLNMVRKYNLWTYFTPFSEQSSKRKRNNKFWKYTLPIDGIGNRKQCYIIYVLNMEFIIVVYYYGLLAFDQYDCIISINILAYHAYRIIDCSLFTVHIRKLQAMTSYSEIKCGKIHTK